ncbi:hypothetical protein [Archangium violaceum]|uniref:hypothetical protein n=1 Tax=Archangium violaceum TaxID=83451 RepID=UPI0036DAF2B2
MRKTFTQAAIVAVLFTASTVVAGNIWTIQTAPNPSGPTTGQPIAGGGAWITNKPQGYYIGRIMVGQRFNVQETSPANWHFGRAMDTVNMCGWTMPGSMATKVGSTSDSCSAATRSALFQRLTIGKNFSSAGNTYAVIGATATNCPFYYNYFYGTDYPNNEGAWANSVYGVNYTGRVDYRYQTRQGGAYVVRDANSIWGFMPSYCVALDHYGVFNDPD